MKLSLGTILHAPYFESELTYLSFLGYYSFNLSQNLEVCSHKTVETRLFLLLYTVFHAAFFFNVHAVL